MHDILFLQFRLSNKFMPDWDFSCRFLIGRHMTSLLKSGKSLNISGDQTGRVKHKSGEHMNLAIDC